MTCLVTGGAGFIGSHLVDRLLALGHEVIIVDNFSWGREENIAHHTGNPHVTLYRHDIREPLDAIFSKHSIDRVFHLAALHKVQYSIENPKETHDVNIDGTVNLLHACKDFKVGRLVFSSSAAVYGNQKESLLHEDLVAAPLSPYALHKSVGEHYMQLFYLLYKLETVSLRYFNAFGPRQDPYSGYAGVIPKFMHLMATNTAPVINGDGLQTRDFVYIDDVIDANIRAAFTENSSCLGKAINIGSGREVSVKELFSLIRNLSKKDIDAVHGPSVIEVTRCCAALNAAHDILSWQPTMAFEDGLAATYAYFEKFLAQEQGAPIQETV